jgi:hypothetical protein
VELLTLPGTSDNLDRPFKLWKVCKRTPWPESASELYRPSDRRLSAKLVPTFSDRWCHVVSVIDLYSRILGFLDRSRYFSFQAAPQLYSRGWVDPIPDPPLLRKSGSAGNRTRTPGFVAWNSHHYTTEAVMKDIGHENIWPRAVSTPCQRQAILALSTSLSSGLFLTLILNECNLIHLNPFGPCTVTVLTILQMTCIAVSSKGDIYC